MLVLVHKGQEGAQTTGGAKGQGKGDGKGKTPGAQGDGGTKDQVGAQTTGGQRESTFRRGSPRALRGSGYWIMVYMRCRVRI